MINLIIFVIIVLTIIIITIMYLKSVQINNTEIRYNIVMRLLIVSLLTILFLENKQQTGVLGKITHSIKTYMSDAGKTMMDFIDNRTKDISQKLDNIENKTDSINNKLDGIGENVSSINENINKTRESIIFKIDSNKHGIIDEIQRYFQNQIDSWIEEKMNIGPGGIRTIW